MNNFKMSISKFLFVSALIISFQTLSAQNFTSFEYDKIDKLFERYTVGMTPGYALGIVKDGQLMYSKGYGLANLEYALPITDSSAFYIGSMAKQFTAAALLILENEGLVDLSKPVYHYLDDFPNYDKEITINHLLHHTSGIRETNSLQLFQGIDRKFEEVFDTDDLYRLIVDQKELNFSPGDEFRYSSGGYAVLAKLVEKLSNKTFREFLRTKIFNPLGMDNTLVYDNHNELVPYRVDSYWPIGQDAFEKRNQLFDAYGDGGIITTVKDLAKWDQAFYSDVLGVPDFSEKMYRKSLLNNGVEIDYARALNVWEYKGLKLVNHNGGMLGFRVDMLRIPARKTTIILLGNSAYLDPTGDALKIIDILFKDVMSNSEKQVLKATDKNVKVPTSTLKNYQGFYWTDQTNYYRRITLQNDSLFIDSGNDDYKQYLKPISQNEFLVKGSDPSMQILFNGGDDELVMHIGHIKRIFRKFDPEPPSTMMEVEPLIGTYWSNELQSNYEIFKKNDVLFLKINRNEPEQIFPLPENSNKVWNGKRMLWIGFGELKFSSNPNGEINGFLIGDGRVSGVEFIKERL